MKRNSIFDPQRFMGLIGTGILKRKAVHDYYIILIFTICLVGIFIVQLIENLEFEIARRVITRIYQMAYIVFLTVPTFRLVTNPERSIQWSLIPASSFEKYLFITIFSYIWRTVIFLGVMYFFDYLMWADTPSPDGLNLSQCQITLSQFFMLDLYEGFMPKWLYCTLIFFFYAALPILIASDRDKNSIRTRPLAGGYFIYLIFKSILDDDIIGDSVYIVVSGFAILVFVVSMVGSIRRSCSLKA